MGRPTVRKLAGCLFVAALLAAPSVPDNRAALRAADSWISPSTSLSAGEGTPGSGEFLIHQWTTADGLPGNFVGEILRGEKGYLWLTGGGGLVRFDGREFKVFTRSDIDGWQTSFVQEIFEDRSGALWLVSRRGTLTRFQEGRFTTYDWRVPAPTGTRFYDAPDGKLWISSGGQIARVEEKRAALFSVEGRITTGNIQGFCKDRMGRLWAFSNSALLQKQDGHFAVVDTTRHIRRISERRAGGVWVATNGGLFRFDNGRFLDHAVAFSSSERIRQMYEDRRGRLWVSTGEERLIRLDGTTRTVYTTGDGLPSGPVRKIYEQRNGRLWVVSHRGRLAYLAGDHFKRVSLGDDLSSPNIMTLQEDREGNLWIGATTGLFRLSNRTIEGYTRRNGLPGDLIFPILQDDEGAVWMGLYEGGLHRLSNGKVDGPKTTLTVPDGLPSNYVRSLHEAQAGGLWVGTGNGYVAHVKGERVRAARAVSPQGSRIRAIYEDRRGRLWVGGNNLFLIGGDSVRRYGPAPLRRGDATIRAIHKAQSGAVWVTSKKGLFRWKDGRWRRFTTADGLPSNFVLSVHEEADGTLWFTTHGAGLVHYDGGNFFTYTTADGLHSDSIWQILEDGRGYFWMSSNTGLFRIRKQSLDRLRAGKIDRVNSRVFTVADGMPNSECAHTQPAGWKTKDGRLWFPTIEGAAIVDPSQVPHAGRSPPVRLQQVRANGQRLDWRRTHVLKSGQSNLAFYFAALSFSAPQRTRYRYKLGGYDEEWRMSDTRRAAFYTNLPPGRYRFRVQARNGSGGWTREGASFAFTLQPHFWQTAWFYLLCTAGLIGLFYGAHWIRLRHVREQELEELVERRTRALREEKEKTEEQAERLEALNEARRRLFEDLSHELRTPLTMISTPLHTVLSDADGVLAEDTRELLEVAHRNSKQLEDLVDQVMALSRLEAGRLSLEPQPGDLVAFAHETTRSFEPMAERYDIQLRFRADPDQLPSVFDPEKLRSVLGNLIENALHYTPDGGKALVRVERPDEKTAALRVSDTGPGIPEDEMSDLFERFHRGENAQRHRTDGSGLGLALAKELTELHNGAIDVESEVGLGSTFTVHLPLREPEDEPTTPSEGDRDVGSPGIPPRPFEDGKDSIEGSGSQVQSRAGEETTTSSAESSPTVLVVEDNADVCTYLRGQLSDAYCIREAQDGEEALDRARAEPPDLILSDVMMPGVDGMELCRRVKSDDALRDVPVLLLTAKAGAEAEVEGLDAGADAYVEKPFSMETLRARIQNLIDARAALRDQYRDEITVEPSGVSVTPEEKEFYEEARAVVEAHIDESGFTVEQFAGDLSVSRSTLRRRLKDATGQTPAEFVRHLRLERAAQLLQEDSNLRVYEVADAVGYESPDHFGRLFREHFDVSPSEYPEEE